MQDQGWNVSLSLLSAGPAGSHTVLGNGVTNGDVVSERSYTSEYTEDEQARLYLIRFVFLLEGSIFIMNFFCLFIKEMFCVCFQIWSADGCNPQILPKTRVSWK